MRITVSDVDVSKYQHITRQSEDAFAAARELTPQWMQARENVRRLETSIELMRHHPHGTPTPALLKELDNLRLQEERLADHRDQVTQANAPRARLAARLTEFLQGAGLDPRLLPVADPYQIIVAGPPPTIEEMDVWRQRGRELKAKRKAIADAPVSQAEAHGRVDRYLSSVSAELDDVSANAFIGPGRSDSQFEFFPSETGDYNGRRARRLQEALLIVVGRDAVRTLLVDRADRAAAARGGWGLPESDRQRELRRLDDAIFAAEVAEERTIEQLEARGVDVVRRPDADCRAVLLLPEAVPA